MLVGSNLGLIGSGGGGNGTGQVVAFIDSSTSGGYSSTGASWTGNTLAATSSLLNQGRLCAWNGTTYVFIYGNGVDAQTSTDGINWSDRGPIDVGIILRSICWNGTVFCAVGGATNNSDATKEAYTTPDGITWTKHTMPEVSAWSSVCWTGTQFVAVSGAKSGGGNTTNAATSPDGVTWSSQTLPSSAAWRSICWNGTILAAIGDGAAGSSPDGVTWTARTLAAVSPFGLAWNGSVFCTIDGSTQDSYTSPDGITWTKHTGAMPSSAAWYDICWNGTVFVTVATTTKGATSPDGITWTAVTMPSSGNWQSVAANWLNFGTY